MPVVRLLALGVAKTFSKLFGLATITFFGRAPSRDDDKLGGIGLLSVTWPFTVAALAFPSAAEVLIPFAPENDAALRAISAALVLGIPLAVGVLLHTVQNQPWGQRAALRKLGLAYLYTPAIGGLVVALVVVVPVIKAGYLVRRYEHQHVAVMVPEGAYDRLREHARDLLAADGIETEVSAHPWLIRQLFSALSWVEGHIFRRGMSTRMQRLVGQAQGGRFELTLHATDLSIIGTKDAVSVVFALLAERIDPRVAYLSWDDTSQRIEDEIANCRDDIDAGRPCDRELLADIAGRLRREGLSPPEWDAIRRQLYRVEADSERLRAGAAREHTS